MCLIKVSLTTQIIDGRVIGTGYKQIDETLAKSYGKRWIKAEGKMYNHQGLEKLVISAGDRIPYHPGFHIFLTEEDAKKYTGGLVENLPVYEVQFRDIMAFGQNKCYHDMKYYFITDKNHHNGWVLKPCIVAKWMRVVKKLENSSK